MNSRPRTSGPRNSVRRSAAGVRRRSSSPLHRLPPAPTRVHDRRRGRRSSRNPSTTTAAGCSRACPRRSHHHDLDDRSLTAGHHRQRSRRFCAPSRVDRRPFPGRCSRPRPNRSHSVRDPDPVSSSRAQYACRWPRRGGQQFGVQSLRSAARPWSPNPSIPLRKFPVSATLSAPYPHLSEGAGVRWGVRGGRRPPPPARPGGRKGDGVRIDRRRRGRRCRSCRSARPHGPSRPDPSVALLTQLQGVLDRTPRRTRGLGSRCIAGLPCESPAVRRNDGHEHEPQARRRPSTRRLLPTTPSPTTTRRPAAAPIPSACAPAASSSAGHLRKGRGHQRHERPAAQFPLCQQRPGGQCHDRLISAATIPWPVSAFNATGSSRPFWPAEGDIGPRPRTCWPF